MKRLLIVFAVILILVVAFVFTQKDSSSTFTEVMQKPAMLFADKSTNAANSEKFDPTAVTESAAEAIGGVPSEFKNWVTTQSLDLEKSSINPQQLEEELTKKSLQLTLQERAYLQAIVLDQKAAATQKIFSVYVLGLDANGSQVNLEEIIKAPLQIGDNYTTHSPEETLSMQEKTLRRLAIDSLIEKAKAESSYKTQLQAMANDITDPTLKRYLERKLQEIR